MLVTKLTAVLNDKSGARRAHAGGIKGQSALKALQQIKNEEAGKIEKQQRRRIGGPMLLFAFAGAGNGGKGPARSGTRIGDKNVRSPLKTRVM